MPKINYEMFKKNLPYGNAEEIVKYWNENCLNIEHESHQFPKRLIEQALMLLGIKIES